MSTSFLSFVVVVAGFLSGFQGLSAQTVSTVTCDAKDYGWASNSVRQNPCQVAATLIGACTGGNFVISPLDPGNHYAAPDPASQEPCHCSSVVYMLISACGDCQNRIFLNWADYSAGCSTTYFREYHGVIPPGTPVPAWAYLNASIGYRPDAARGYASQNFPEITVANQPTITQL